MDFLELTLPSRLIAFNVDGVTVFVDIWARTPEDLAAWLPQATTFVDNLRFSSR